MADNSFQYAVKIVSEAQSRSPSDATRFLFDHYRTASTEFKEALVLALIGEIAFAVARRDRAPFLPATPIAERSLDRPEVA